MCNLLSLFQTSTGRPVSGSISTFFAFRGGSQYFLLKRLPLDSTIGLFSAPVSGCNLGAAKMMTKGTVVSIKFGPFAGLSGVVIATSGERTTVRIRVKERAVLIELDANMIQVPVRHGVQHLRQRTRPV